MAQRRMVSRTISTSKKVGRISDKAALLYTWIIPQTDDFGHMDGDAGAVKAIVVPMRKFSVKDVEKCLVEMESQELIRRYTVKGEKFLEICNFESFQTFKNDRNRQKLYPSPDEGTVEPSGIQTIPADTASEVKRREEKGSEEKGMVVAGATQTPKEITQNFFEIVKENGEKLQDFVAKVSQKHGVPSNSVTREIRKFSDYWTEKNKSGTKTKWEMQQTFEVNRRLATWFNRSRDFGGSSGKKFEVGVV